MDAPLPEVADRRLPSLSPHRRLPSLLPPLCCIGRRRPTPATHTPFAIARCAQRPLGTALAASRHQAKRADRVVHRAAAAAPKAREADSRGGGAPATAPLQLLCGVPPRIPPSRHLSRPPTTRHTLAPPVSAGEQMARRLPRRASGPLRQAQGRVRQARRQAGDLVNCADAPVRHGSSSQT